MSKPTVLSVSACAGHSFSKPTRESIELIQGLGVSGDAHAGVTVKHRSRVAQDPTLPNLRQVHLIHSELLAELETKGFSVLPGQLGENITTSGLDILGLPRGTVLLFGSTASIEITGLRNPCRQIDGLYQGLMEATLERKPSGLVRKAGVMAIVTQGGVVRVGDEIAVRLPPEPHLPLAPV